MVPDKVLGIGDVRKALSANLIPGMKDAEAALAVAEQLCIDNRLGESAKLHAIGIMSVNLALATIKKVHKDVPKLQSVSDAGQMFIEHLRVLAGNPSIASPWVASTSSPGGQGKVSKPAASKAAASKSTVFLGVQRTDIDLFMSELYETYFVEGKVFMWADIKTMKVEGIGLRWQIRRCGIVDRQRLCCRHAGEEKVGWLGGNHQADDPQKCVAYGWGH